MSQFAFLAAEWPDVHEAASRAESLTIADPRTACFHARRALELAVRWMYRHDAALRSPYQHHLSALLHEPTFARTTGEAVAAKARLVKEIGNGAVHSARPVRPQDAVAAVRELFQVSWWLAHTYARGTRPDPSLAFDASRLSAQPGGTQQTPAQLAALERANAEKDERLAALRAERGALDAELARLREEIARAKSANTAVADAHDYSEAETRDIFIDVLLREAGWAIDTPADREFEVHGMPNEQGVGYVDYVLWGDDGLPLGLVEAKRTKRDPRVGEQQAKLYADCLERQYGVRPVLFLSNGYEHWIWDDVSFPKRSVQGFYTKDELHLLVQRRSTARPLAEAEIDGAIVERHYQHRAIRRVCDAFERDKLRKALIVMATGAGKTRTIVALCDLLMRCNRAKRVLFLADRTALVNQAVRAFKAHLPDAAPVSLVTDRESDGRVYVSTYPTMMNLIDELRDGCRRFGVGAFDLVVIDEAHRSVFQKYRAILDWFDAPLVGLTATPKDDVDRSTYALFDLERGVPTDSYSLEEAVGDGYLVPATSVSVPLRYQREGIRYDDLSEEEQTEWDELEWGDEQGAPDRVEPDAVSKWFFNADTVDKVLEHLMTRGQKVAGGDRLGKTIVFAKNHAHAVFIAERFDVNYPHMKGAFARVVDFQVAYAQSLIDDFSKAEKMPHIAISVDMLDTGIDVPEVVNLVFFKVVRSKTKFWQMVGRGTRLSPDLFGPGRDKRFFFIFDWCGNLEFFGQDPDATDGSTMETLSARLFRRRLELIAVLDDPAATGCGSVREIPPAYGVLRGDTAELLRAEVASMRVENFVVRPKRSYVERYSQRESWARLGADAHDDLSHHVAGLPTELEPEPEEAKQFDLLLLNLQLAVLRAEPGLDRMRDRLKAIAGLLEERSAIPAIREQITLIHDVQSDVWWDGVTATMLEEVRRRLRALVHLIEKRSRTPVYTDFEDVQGAEVEVYLPGISPAVDSERFRAKARALLRRHEDAASVRKLRMNEPLTVRDLEELEGILAASGAGGAEEIRQAASAAQGLGLFVRSLVGLDREAAKRGLSDFLSGGVLTANQIEFANLVVDHLTEHGVMDPARLYESPFTDFDGRGPEGLFSRDQVDRLVASLRAIRAAAVAA